MKEAVDRILDTGLIGVAFSFCIVVSVSIIFIYLNKNNQSSGKKNENNI